MFAYCDNNPVCRADYDGASWVSATYVYDLMDAGVNLAHTKYNKSLKVHGYICNQTRGTASKYWFGFFRSSYNGCGWIATYNALLMLRNRMEPHEIISKYEKSGAVMYGSFGIRPDAIKKFFKSKGYKVTMTYNSANFDKVAKKNKANIIWFWHGSGAHFVALRWTGVQFVGYNTFGYSDGVDYWGSSISDFFKKNGFSSGILISLR